MRDPVRFLGRWCVVLALCFVASVRAADVPAQDEAKIHTLIESQIAAFAADDGPKAFSYAAPALRQSIGSADRFMEMVRTQYPVVYRHKSVTFLSVAAVGDSVVQAVQFTDLEGNIWLAVYEVQQQSDDSWRIGGCVVKRTNEVVI